MAVVNTHKIGDPAQGEDLAGKLRERDRAPEDVVESVRRIVEDVRLRGDAAVLELTERYDGLKSDASSLEVHPSRMRQALSELDESTRRALQKAASRIERFAEKGMPVDWTLEQAAGVTVGQVRRPVDTAGIYAPGGRFSYPSTVLMTAIPAKVAGVERIVMCVPPSEDGNVKESTLAAAALIGGCRLFKVGGAQAIAAMAFGTETIPRCGMVAGPGNVYVATAKRLIGREVTVDLDAGPSEVAIYLEGAAGVTFAAADLMAQLEHDPLAVAVLVTEEPATMEAAAGRLREEGPGPEGRIDIALSAGRDTTLAFINALAPEHLELMVEEAAALLPRIRAAGCVFLGPYSAVAMGDYIAGPSHVLPTGGAAARLSGLRAEDFTRVINVVSYEKEGLEEDAEDAIALAKMEGLALHAKSVEARLAVRDTRMEV